MPFFDRTIREMAASQMISLLVGLVAGILLASTTEKIALLPGFLIMLPGFLEMRGNISGSLSSRISSGLFLRIIKPGNEMKRIAQGNLIASFMLALTVSAFLGFLAFSFTYMTTGLIVFRILLIPIIAGLIANAIEIPMTFYLTVYLYNKGHDPNNVMGPFLTSTGDITSVASLIIAMAIL